MPPPPLPIYEALADFTPGRAAEYLAMVLPLWYPERAEQERVNETLWLNLHGSDAYLPARQVYLVVDGNKRAARAVQHLRERRAAAGLEPYSEVHSPENRGKAGALLLGWQAVLAECGLAGWIVTRDADGDHMLMDLPRLLAMAHQMADGGAERLCVVGSRVDLRRPMTWLRGELEVWANLLVVEAVQYALAREGRLLNRRWWLPRAGVPDLNSGYKLYSRSVVEATIAEYDALTAAGGETRDMLKYAMEVVPFVIASLTGQVGEVVRAGMLDQTLTSFTPETYVPMFRTIPLYAARRCSVPREQVPLWLANTNLHSPLWTDPRGREVLSTISTQVLAALGCEAPLPGGAPGFL